MSCIFCKILTGEIPAPKVHETESAFVIRDIAPQAPTHLLVVPRKHLASLNDLSPSDRERVLPALYQAADEVAEKLGFRAQGYRTVINNQSQAGQTVFHLHMHVLAGAPLKGGFGA